MTPSLAAPTTHQTASPLADLSRTSFARGPAPDVSAAARRVVPSRERPHVAKNLKATED
jgi:hypothetical protein